MIFKNFFLAVCFLGTFSTPLFAGESVTGIVSQAECNRPTGYGFLEVQTREGQKLVARTYKVNSADLCSKEVPSPFSLTGKGVPLTEIAAKNYLGAGTLSTFHLDGEFVVGLAEDQPVDRVRYTAGVPLSFGNSNREAIDWYMANRRSF